MMEYRGRVFESMRRIVERITNVVMSSSLVTASAFGLMLGLSLFMLSFWNVVTSAGYPSFFRSTGLSLGAVISLFASSKLKEHSTKELWQILVASVGVLLWLLVMGVFFMWLPTPIAEVTNFVLTWRVLSRVKTRQKTMESPTTYYAY